MKGYAQCPCGSSLSPFTVKPRKGKPHFYYVCDKQRRHGKGACLYAKYHAAGDLEERVGEFVLGLIRNPETLREQVEAEAARERATLRDQRKYIAALASRLNEADSERDRLVRLYARGGLSDDEYDSYTAEIGERKEVAEEELARLEEARRNIDYLDELPRLIEDCLNELPQLVEELARIREYTPSDEHKARHKRDRHNGDGPGVFDGRGLHPYRPQASHRDRSRRGDRVEVTRIDGRGPGF